MVSAYTSINGFIEEYTKAQKRFHKEMAGAFEKIFAEFFEKTPEITGVYWNQYTPYFNDGEPCEFRVNEIYFTDMEDPCVSELESYSDSEQHKYREKPSAYVYKNVDNYPSYKEEVAAYEEAAKDPSYARVTQNIEELREVLGSIPEEIYLKSFDDHVFVLATKNDVQVEEYDHD